MAIHRVKGTYDVLPEESANWQALEERIRAIFRRYHVLEMRTPMMEYSAVFHRKNEHSDMVTKETYNFKDRSQRDLTLRPEGTAGIIRSYVEHKMYANQDLEKVYYIGPNFRYERPQKGRYRQFYQFGVEAIGAVDPALDAEMIMLAYDFFQELGLKGVRVKINSLGNETSRSQYHDALVQHLTPHKDSLCDDCKVRLDKNPLRILDCKIDHHHPAVLSAPTPYDYLDDESAAYFKAVRSFLDAANIDYDIDKRMVRGLDYYSHTVFEIEADIEGFGAQNVLGGGGRYQGLVKELGGPALGGIGFACGMERVLDALAMEGIDIANHTPLHAYIIAFGKETKQVASSLLYRIRKAHLNADMNYTGKGFKGQLKQALKQEALYMIILGEDELKRGEVGIKNTKTQQQENINIQDVVDYLLKRG